MIFLLASEVSLKIACGTNKLKKAIKTKKGIVFSPRLQVDGSSEPIHGMKLESTYICLLGDRVTDYIGMMIRVKPNPDKEV